jgi:hypothetical protein
MPPYHTIYVDGLGGQKSFRVKSYNGTPLEPSYHGAVGAYVFVDAESDDISVKLYKRKSQFPDLLRSFLLSVLAIHYVVRRVVIDNASELVSQDVSDLAEEYGFILSPAAPYTPQGNSLAENAVGIVCTITRALMLGAPHLPRNRWGLAIKHAALINHVLPKARNGGRSAYEVIRKVAPNLKRMFFKVFGAPVQYKCVKPDGKVGERTLDGFYVGVDWPSVLVDDRETRKVIRRSMTKLRVYQGAYCDKAVTDVRALKRLIELVDCESNLESLEVPKSLPSIRELINQGEKGVSIDENSVHTEDCLEIEQPEVRKAVRQKLASVSKVQESDSPGEVVTGAVTRAMARARAAGVSIGPSEQQPVTESVEVEDEPSISHAIDIEVEPAPGNSSDPNLNPQGIDMREGEDEPDPTADVDQQENEERELETRLALDGVNPRSIYLTLARKECNFREKEALRLEPYYTLRVLCDPLVLREKYENQIDGYKYPRSTWEALLKADWREWLASIRKEFEGWKTTKTFKHVRWSNVDPKVPVIRLGELFLIKSNGKYKFRQYARGDMLEKGVDYKTTFSATVGADTIRFFFSIGTALNLKFRGGDVVCAYLIGRQRTPLYCYPPSYAHIVDLSEQEIVELRNTLIRLVAQKGKGVIKDFARDQQGKCPYVWELLKSVYGVPDAGNEFALERDSKLVGKLGFTKSKVDQCLYWKTGHVSENGQFYPRSTRDSVWVSKEVDIICLLAWVDDLPSFATDRMWEWYKRSMSDVFPMEYFDPLKEFVSIEVSQDLDRGITELKQPKYWSALRVRFGKYLPDKFNVKVPIPENTKTMPGTEAEHKLAAHLPYPELVGAIAYPAAHTKLELRYAISILSRYMSNWTLGQWELALQTLKYGISTKEIGLMFSRLLDKHGVNVLSAWADSNFDRPPERSAGCSIVMNNGAAIHLTSKRHTTIDTSTTAAELTEMYLCSNHVMGFRNIMSEMGFDLSEPTVIYQDNRPAIDIANNNRNMSESTKHMDVRVFKVRERIEDQDVYLEYVRTCGMLADICTKALGARQFTFLRDLMNGYAIVRARYPDFAFKCNLVLSKGELFGDEND